MAFTVTILLDFICIELHAQWSTLTNNKGEQSSGALFLELEVLFVQIVSLQKYVVFVVTKVLSKLFIL